ncbi:hypothetical protein [Eikenella sp. NML01-A-086]|nr:hypothetical protein [Eikenella sp. NML01-A-086]
MIPNSTPECWAQTAWRLPENRAVAGRGIWFAGGVGGYIMAAVSMSAY